MSEKILTVRYLEREPEESPCVCLTATDSFTAVERDLIIALGRALTLTYNRVANPPSASQNALN